MTAPNQEEKNQIHQLREKLRINNVPLTNEQGSDPYLVRWIRAGNHDLGKAEEMLLNSLIWRQENGVDFILHNPVDPFFLHNFPFWADSMDKLGHPVIEFPVGVWNFNSLTSSPSLLSGFKNYTIYYFERIMEAVKEINYANPYRRWPVTQYTMIADMKSYNPNRLLDQKALEANLEFSTIFENHYPDTIYKAYCINLPPTLPLVVAMATTVHDKRTLEKCHFYYEEEDWKSILMEEIGEDQLGHMYGGKKVRMVGDNVFNYNLNSVNLASESSEQAE